MDSIETITKLSEQSQAVKRRIESFVKMALSQPDPPITISRARELLGFEKMEDMRKWMDKNIKSEVIK